MTSSAAVWPAIAVVGAGSVGSYFGGLLARAGLNVTLIGRPAHVQAIAARGLQLLRGRQTTTIPIAASQTLAAAAQADWVLVSVKSTDTEAVAQQLAPLLAPHALVLSLQNGVENVERMRRYIRQPVVPAAVYVATALPEPGVVEHFGRGELVIGPADARDAADADLQQRLTAVKAVFECAGVPVDLSPRVNDALWAKLLVNCAYNAVSAITQLPYGALAAIEPVRELQRALVQEVVTVARAEGRDLDVESGWAAVEQIAQTMPGQRSSTAQDLTRGRPTEIDHLNGVIVRRAAAQGLSAPANQAVLAMVKALQARGAAGPEATRSGPLRAAGG